MEELDKRILSEALGWKVAAMAWANTTRMFADACRAKRLDLRVRDDNPARDIQGPERGTKKEKQYLWPSEFVALITSPVVPLRWKRLFALAVYAYARAGEIASLSCEDIAFDNATLHIHQSTDRVRKRGVKATKTGVSRRIPIEPNLAPLLRVLHAEAKGKGRVIGEMPAPSMLARKLKYFLKKAGVKRAELFATDATRKAITFHDLRATGITWMAARGDDPLKIMSRAGHASFQTTQGYIREAENLGGSFGAVFPALPLLDRGSAIVLPGGETDDPNDAGGLDILVGATGFEREAESGRNAAKSGESAPVAESETPVRSGSRGLLEDLAHAMVLAADAGRWELVATLARQLDSLTRASDGAPLRLVHHGPTRPSTSGSE